MELTKEKIIKSIDTYFNRFLKDSLGYPERYSVEFDSDRNRIALISNQENPILIEKLQNKVLQYDLESKLYSAFKAKNNDILGVNVYPLSDQIIITYTQGETPLTLNEIGILSKLAADTDVEDLNKLCLLNKNFARACKDDLFWWEIIKLKFPEFYVERRTKKYDPRRVIRGLRTYKRILLKMGYKLQIDDEIGDLSREYPETFKYVIYENIFKISPFKFYTIYKTVDLSKQSNIDIVKHIILNIDGDNINLNSLFYRLIRTPGISTDEIDKIDEISKKRGFELYDENLLRETLDEFVLLSNRTDVRLYEWLNDKLGRRSQEFYLNDFDRINGNSINLMKYILNKLSDSIDKYILISMLVRMINTDEVEKFTLFYNKYRYLIDKVDKEKLLDRVYRHQRPNTINFINFISKN